MTVQAGDPGFSLKAAGAVARRQAMSRGSRWVLLAATMVGLGVLGFLAYDVVRVGAPHLSADFITSYASRNPENAGVRSALLGTIWVLGLTIAFAIPVAVGTAIWMEEFAPKNRLLSFARLNVANLAGVPSIIYGILGLAVFVRFLDLGPTIIAGALTLTLMILPMTIIASVEAIKQVPPSMRDASLALGATRWQTVWHHVLPSAVPGIMTGTILAIARAAGETAALIMIGGLAFIAYDPQSINDGFTLLPIQAYSWTIRPGEDFRGIASAAIIVLMIGVVGLNLVAVIIRERFRQH